MNQSLYDTNSLTPIWHNAVCRPSNRPTVSVVIPALNEAESLPFVLQAIPDEWVDEVLLVDGRSQDGTVDVACDVRDKTRVVIQHGKGKGAAIRSGFAAAMGDIVILMDADGSTDPREIPAFVGALVSGADFAKGSRFLQGGGTDDMPFHRRLANRWLTMLANVIAGTHYTDITYGYNATWRRHAHKLALDIDGWANEIITNLRAARGGLRVVEVASFERPRIAGQAKLAALPAGWTIFRAMLKELFSKKRRAHDGKVTEQSILSMGGGQPERLIAWQCDRPPAEEHLVTEPDASEAMPISELER
jgi:glycosyltransferase involved in cell wall biosynthesis